MYYYILQLKVTQPIRKYMQKQYVRIVIFIVLSSHLSGNKCKFCTYTFLVGTFYKNFRLVCNFTECVFLLWNLNILLKSLYDKSKEQFFDDIPSIITRLLLNKYHNDLSFAIRFYKFVKYTWLHLKNHAHFYTPTHPCAQKLSFVIKVAE